MADKREDSPRGSHVTIGKISMTIYMPSGQPPPFYRHRYFWWVLGGAFGAGFMLCFVISATTSDPALLQWGVEFIMDRLGFPH